MLWNNITTMCESSNLKKKHMDLRPFLTHIKKKIPLLLPAAEFRKQLKDFFFPLLTKLLIFLANIYKVL